MKKLTENTVENLNKKLGRELDSIEIAKEINNDHAKYLE